MTAEPAQAVIEIIKARDGSPVLRKNGRLLASSVDPIAEAATWANKVCTAAGPRDAIIILGLGTGYHVVELLNRRADSPLIVIENDDVICEKARALLPALARARIVVEKDWSKLIESQDFRDAIGGVYHVAVHGATSQIEDVFVRSVEALLRGRDKLSFLLLLKTRSDLLGLLDPDAIATMPAEPVSIKTLAGLFGPKALASRERRVWRILEELVL